MQIHLSARHLKTTPAIYSYVADKIGHLEHLTDNIIAAHIVLWLDETRASTESTKSTKDSFVVKAHLSLPGPDVFAEEHGSDLYVVIDMITDNLSRQLRKRKTKLIEHKKSKAQRSKERARQVGSAI
ncbi:MAG: ribosome-associated translation inhibitor RaiA [Verrucomicrobiota bacterium]|nr:ribosome-associated translation inhibitor RaiA [Verrucomicrobiota bacterium]